MRYFVGYELILGMSALWFYKAAKDVAPLSHTRALLRDFNGCTAFPAGPIALENFADRIIQHKYVQPGKKQHNSVSHPRKGQQASSH